MKEKKDSFWANVGWTLFVLFWFALGLAVFVIGLLASGNR